MAAEAAATAKGRATSTLGPAATIAEGHAAGALGLAAAAALRVEVPARGVELRLTRDR